MEATKRPWEFDESGFNFKSELGHSVGTIRGGDLNDHLLTVWKDGDIGKNTAIANARLIVTAVNHFDEMVEVLKFSLSVHRSQGQFDLSERMAVEKIDDLLAKIADPQCPGDINRRKLEAIQGLVEAAEKILLHRFLNDLHPIDYGRLEEALTAIKKERS